MGGRTFFREQRPVTGQSVDEKELDAEEVLLERPFGDAPYVTQVNDVVAQLVFGQPVGREAEMGGQLPHHSKVGHLRVRDQAGKLHVLDHAFSEFGHDDILPTGL